MGFVAGQAMQIEASGNVDRASPHLALGSPVQALT
jgi:hypothetical protein